MAERTPEEVLRKLLEAVDEARETIRDLHVGRKALIETAKSQERQVSDLLAKAVDEAVRQLQQQAASDMEDAILEVIGRLEADWRSKLGLGS